MNKWWVWPRFFMQIRDFQNNVFIFYSPGLDLSCAGFADNQWIYGFAASGSCFIVTEFPQLATNFREAQFCKEKNRSKSVVNACNTRENGQTPAQRSNRSNLTAVLVGWDIESIKPFLQLCWAKLFCWYFPSKKCLQYYSKLWSVSNNFALKTFLCVENNEYVIFLRWKTAKKYLIYYNQSLLSSK